MCPPGVRGKGSWKWAGSANKQRGGAQARHANTFTYVHSHDFQQGLHAQLYSNKRCTCGCGQHLHTFWGKLKEGLVLFNVLGMRPWR